MVPPVLDCWHDLRDPEPKKNNNLKLNGKEYNYRAAATHRVLVQLEGGMLTRYPLSPVTSEPTEKDAIEIPIEDDMPNRFNVALSFPGENRDFVLEVAKTLADELTPERVFYDEWYEVELLGVGGDLKLQGM
jgi:hypothetical protein